MTWKMLYNGKCPYEVPAFKFVKVDMGNTIHLALDNSGRIFCWGSTQDGYTGQTPVPSGINFLAHPAIFDGGTSGLQMRYPYQVGNLSDWRDISISLDLAAAQDKNGYIYAWGYSWNGEGGWLPGSKYLEPNEGFLYIPGGENALVPTLVNNTRWKRFVNGDSCMFAIGLDLRLYVWGWNYFHLFGMPEWTDDEMTTTPILVNTLPDLPVKLVASESWSAIAVLENNDIYVWGESSNYDIATPTLIPLSIPSGVSVITAKASYGGYSILLSNGSVYCIGEEISGGATDLNWHLMSSGHTFVELDAYAYGVAARDNNGVLWGWGEPYYLISRDDAYCNQNSSIPVIITNQNSWITFAVGERSHAAIDQSGRLWTWGSDLFGSLGVDWSESDPSASCSTLQVAHPTLDSGEIVGEGVLIG